MLQLNKHVFDLKRPLLMGILNITPDSFSDGGQHRSVKDAVDHAQHAAGLALLHEGEAVVPKAYNPAAGGQGK